MFPQAATDAKRRNVRRHFSAAEKKSLKTMKYIKFKIPKSKKEIERDSIFKKYFLNGISLILKKIIPNANPDFDNLIDDVEYWNVECETESGIPEREIGIDKNGIILLKMPFKNNYGYWTDNNFKLNDFIEKFKAIEIEKTEFEFKWESFGKNKFEYVYVEENGNVRELDKDETEYLSETFHPNDGGRPYIKRKYNDLTPDGKIWGFIARKNVPKNLLIENKKANA